MHHLSSSEDCIQGLMMSARLYSIRRIIRSPSEQWNEIYLTCYLSYIHALSPRVHLEICISAGDYSKRRVAQCCLLFVCMSVPRNFSRWSARHFLSASVACLLGSSVCRWTSSAKRWTTQTGPSPSSSAEMRWSGIRWRPNHRTPCILRQWSSSGTVCLCVCVVRKKWQYEVKWRQWIW